MNLGDVLAYGFTIVLILFLIDVLHGAMRR